MKTYAERTYRKLVRPEGLVSFQVKLKDSDLAISAEKNLETEALRLLEKYRSQIEDYIARDPEFRRTLIPYEVKTDAPEIVRVMAEAARKSGVGPMAAVAGAISEFVGGELRTYSKEIIIENGGDIFIASEKEHTVAVFAGESRFSLKLGINLKAANGGIGICTSSGKVGPSLSFGKADSVTIISKSCALADAAATSIGNVVKAKVDIKEGLEIAASIDGVEGALIIVDDKLGVWGNIELKEV